MNIIEFITSNNIKYAILADHIVAIRVTPVDPENSAFEVFVTGISSPIFSISRPHAYMNKHYEEIKKQIQGLP